MVETLWNDVIVVSRNYLSFQEQSESRTLFPLLGFRPALHPLIVEAWAHGLVLFWSQLERIIILVEIR